MILPGLSQKAAELVVALAKTGTGDYHIAEEFFGEYAIRQLTYFKPSALVTFHSNPNTKYIFLSEYGNRVARRVLHVEGVLRSQYNQMEHNAKVFRIYTVGTPHKHIIFGEPDRVIEDCPCFVYSERDTWLSEMAIANKFRSSYDGKDGKKMYTPDGQYTMRRGTVVAVEAIGHYTKAMKAGKLEFARRYYDQYVIL